MNLEIRPIRPDEFDTYAQTIDRAFSSVLAPDELKDERSVAEHDREFAVFDEGAIVGGSSAVSFRVMVPGRRTVAAAGITRVGVLPTHRRRGINTDLMRVQLEDARGRGEPLAVLHASEGGIYGRFGFGVATYVVDLEVETARSSFLPGFSPSGRVRLLPRDQALPRMRPVFDLAASVRPGVVALDDRWFSWRFTELERDKEAPYFFAVHESDAGEPDAYAVYQVKHEWPGQIPRNVVQVQELMTTTPQSSADIWRYVFDIDLIQTVKAPDRPVDDPLLRMVMEPRRLRPTLRDGMYVRLIDVPAALEARGYAAEGSIVLEVADPFCGWNQGRYELSVSGGSATCRPTGADADLACSVNELAATYMGGSTFGQLAGAGRVEELIGGATARADAIFRSDPSPWCPLPF